MDKWIHILNEINNKWKTISVQQSIPDGGANSVEVLGEYPLGLDAQHAGNLPRRDGGGVLGVGADLTDARTRSVLEHGVLIVAVLHFHCQGRGGAEACPWGLRTVLWQWDGNGRGRGKIKCLGVCERYDTDKGKERWKVRVATPELSSGMLKCLYRLICDTMRRRKV